MTRTTHVLNEFPWSQRCSSHWSSTVFDTTECKNGKQRTGQYCTESAYFAIFLLMFESTYLLDFVCLCWGLWCNQPIRVMLRWASLPNHPFTRQALSSKRLISIVHILLPETDRPLESGEAREWPLKIFHDQSSQKNVADSTRGKPTISWSPIRRASESPSPAHFAWCSPYNVPRPWEIIIILTLGSGGAGVVGSGPWWNSRCNLPECKSAINWRNNPGLLKQTKMI